MRSTTKTESVLDNFVTQAIQLGADEIEVEYKDGHEHVFAMKNGFGVGIGRLPGAAAEAEVLRRELHSLTRRKRSISAGQVEIELRATAFDSFGETAYRVKLRRL